jgi:hypothetical protein
MLPFTFILWQYLPQLRFVQLPWRWLLCLNVAFSLLVAMGMRRSRSRAAVSALMLAGLLVVWNKVQAPWWDKAADIAEMVEDMREARGYEGVDEYVPRDADPSLVKPETPEVAATDGNPDAVRIENWSAQNRKFEVNEGRETEVVVRLFNYPAWRVEVNGRQVIPETQPDTGQMLIPVEAGKNKIEIVFGRTRDRTAGFVLSALTGLVVVGLALWRKRN